MSHTDHLKPWEVETLEALVDAALAKGYAVTVWNGGDSSEISRSTDREAILEACGASDADTLVFSRNVSAGGVAFPMWSKVGQATLIYGNEPGVTIADNSVNAEINELVDGLASMLEVQETKYADAY